MIKQTIWKTKEKNLPSYYDAGDSFFYKQLFLGRNKDDIDNVRWWCKLSERKGFSRGLFNCTEEITLMITIRSFLIGRLLHVNGIYQRIIIIPIFIDRITYNSKIVLVNSTWYRLKLLIIFNYTVLHALLSFSFLCINNRRTIIVDIFCMSDWV